MGYFPVFIELKNKHCLVIGGGPVAFRKAKALIQYDAKVAIIAEEFHPDFYNLKKCAKIERSFMESDLEQANLVVAATDNPSLNHYIVTLCNQRKILVDVANSQYIEDRENGTGFLFPAYVKRGDISVGISCSGKSPILAGHIKEQVEEAVPDEYGELLEKLGYYKGVVFEQIEEESVRRKVLKHLTMLGIDQPSFLNDRTVKSVIKEHLQYEKGKKI